jgi:hypothetical protein
MTQARMTSSESHEVVQSCPVCGGTMILVYQRWALQVCVCRDCYAGIYIPHDAWDIARRKHESPDPPAATPILNQPDQTRPKDT